MTDFLLFFIMSAYYGIQLLMLTLFIGAPFLILFGIYYSLSKADATIAEIEAEDNMRRRRNLIKKKKRGGKR